MLWCPATCTIPVYKIIKMLKEQASKNLCCKIGMYVRFYSTSRQTGRINQLTNNTSVNVAVSTSFKWLLFNQPVDQPTRRTSDWSTKIHGPLPTQWGCVSLADGKLCWRWLASQWVFPPGRSRTTSTHDNVVSGAVERCMSDLGQGWAWYVWKCHNISV